MASDLFPALLRYWRKRRGQSQLELALDAGVSTRHVSFLESGRARPSADMAIRLLSTLDVPLSAQNDALRALGLPARFPEAVLAELEPEIQGALARMMSQHEPYPLTVLGGDFRIVKSNRGADAFFRAFIAEPGHLPESPDLFTLLFDPRFLRPFVEDWPAFAASSLNRLHRERLQRGNDERLQNLLERIIALPDVPRDLRDPDLNVPAFATQRLRLRRGTTSVGFLVTITKFSAPQQPLLEELSIESCFPLDDATRATCERLFHEAP